VDPNPTSEPKQSPEPEATPGRDGNAAREASPAREASAAGSPIGRRFPLLDPFVAALVATVLLALLAPAGGAFAAGLSQAVVVAVAWLFFLYGVRLPTREALAAARDWRLQGSILAATYLLFPIFGLLAAWTSRAFLPSELARGLLFLGLLPSTVQSSIAFTSIAGGNVAAAVCAASLSNLLGVIVTPLLVTFVLDGADVISFDAVGGIAGQLVAPFLSGQILRRWLVPWLDRYRRMLAISDRFAILLVVYVAFAGGVRQGAFSRVAPLDLVLLLVVCAALLGGMLGATHLLGRWLGFQRADRVALLMCGSKKSLASGLPMATLLLSTASVGLLVLPLMVYHQLQLVVCSVLAQHWGRRARACAAPNAGTALNAEKQEKNGA
jgi:sodium/bile acid cotransporter 7